MISKSAELQNHTEVAILQNLPNQTEYSVAHYLYIFPLQQNTRQIRVLKKTKNLRIQRTLQNAKLQ